MPCDAAATRYYPADTVRWRLVDGLYVMLELRSGEYIVLDRVATAMWDILLCDKGAGVDELAARFGVEPSEIAEDLAAFADNCVAGGLLATEPPAPGPAKRTARAPRLPLTLLAWRSLRRAQLALDAGRFHDLYMRLAQRAKPQGTLTEGELARVRAAFRRAENFIMLKAAPRDCLPRSLGLYSYLNSLGIAADHHIGVERFPFNAHAWVESAEGIWFDDVDYVRAFTALATL